jgi:hypothetical protein
MDLKEFRKRNPSKIIRLLLWVSALFLTMLTASCGSGERSDQKAQIAPEGASVVCKLFLAGDVTSEQFYNQVREVQARHGHALHLLCFCAQDPADETTRLEMEQSRITHIPCALFDGYWYVTEPSEDMLEQAVQGCLKKTGPRLSMELRGGIIGGTSLSETFLLCNHLSSLDFDGMIMAYAYENQVSMGTWKADFVCRKLLKIQDGYHIKSGMCLQPLIITWALPEKVDPQKVGVLGIVYDKTRKLLDSVCSEKQCSRTGICD